MNFYKHYLGDYQRDTMRLSMTEDGAYRRLLDEYYATEEPLPLDHEECYRAARALDSKERAAIDKILDKYFQRESDGYHHSRVDEEIQKASKQAETNRKIAVQRESKRKEHESLNETSNDTITNNEPIHNHSQTTNNQNQIQTPEPEKEKPVFVLPEWVDPELWDEWMQIRKRLKAVNTKRAMESLIDKLFAISQAGISVNTALKTAIEKSWKSIELEWIQKTNSGKKDGYDKFLESMNAD